MTNFIKIYMRVHFCKGTRNCRIYFVGPRSDKMQLKNWELNGVENKNISSFEEKKHHKETYR